MIKKVIVCIVFFFLVSCATDKTGIYKLIPQTPTSLKSSVPTHSPIPTITSIEIMTPVVTIAPAMSGTITYTPIPIVPLAIQEQFNTTVTPNPNAMISELVFTNGLDENYQPLYPGTVFQNPVGHMYALFSYENMIPGSQWTVLWYREKSLVYYETTPWEGAQSGMGYTDWEPTPEEWIAGEYELQIFVGRNWIVSGQFTVERDS